MMDVQEAVALLRRFNAWRCGAAHLPYDAEEVAPDPRKVTKAIDTVCAELAKREAVAVPDGLWSFLRDVLRQGAAIESQQGQQGYETFIAHIEAEAGRYEKKLRAILAAKEKK